MSDIRDCIHGTRLYLRCIHCEELETLRARVAKLEAAIQTHKDKYIFNTPDFEDLELWKTIEPKA